MICLLRDQTSCNALTKKSSGKSSGMCANRSMKLTRRTPCLSFGIAQSIPGEVYSWPQAAALFSFCHEKLTQSRPGFARVSCAARIRTESNTRAYSTHIRASLFVQRDLSHEGTERLIARAN